jgi:hypothetical protein
MYSCVQNANGACGSAINVCTTGAVKNPGGDPFDLNKSVWTCAGSGSGTDATCSSCNKGYEPNDSDICEIVSLCKSSRGILSVMPILSQTLSGRIDSSFVEVDYPPVSPPSERCGSGGESGPVTGPVYSNGVISFSWDCVAGAVQQHCSSEISLMPTCVKSGSLIKIRCPSLDWGFGNNTLYLSPPTVHYLNL